LAKLILGLAAKLIVSVIAQAPSPINAMAIIVRIQNAGYSRPDRSSRAA
jgi:hypothetical protein